MAASAQVLDPPFASLDTTVCRHCAEPCGGRAIVTDTGAFCCAGCETVFGLIARHGLTAFYTCDIKPGVSQRGVSRDPGRFAALDEPLAAARLLEPLGGGLTAATLQVPALHCASCLWLLEQLWRFDAGITRSEADLLRRTVRVEFDPERTSLRAVAEQLAAIGYEPVIDPERAVGQPPSSRRDLYLRIGVAGFAFGNVMLFSVPRYLNGAPLEGGFQRLFDALNIGFAMPVLFYSAAPYFRSAWAALRARTMVLEVPVALGLAVLFARSVVDIAAGWGEGFLDSFAGLVFFLLIGRLFQQKAFDGIAFDRTARSFFPLSVRVEQGGASERAAASERVGGSAGAKPPRLIMTALEAIRAGDLMVIRPQEVVPADSVLAEDVGAIDYAFVSGEARPAVVHRGDAVYAGGRVVSRSLRLAAVREVSHSRLAQLWSNPIFSTPRQDWLSGITAAFGFWFVVFAIGLATGGALLWLPDGRMAAQVATAVLIIACPCALTLAAPITLGTAMGLLGRAGVYFKRAAVALDLSRIDTVVFDKTGTLTSGAAEAFVGCRGLSEGEWRLAQRLAAESVHPVSRALAGRDPGTGTVAGVREAPGLGISGTVDGHRVSIGMAGYVQEQSGHAATVHDGGTCIAVDGSVGWARFVTPERPGVLEAVRALASRHDVWLLSGDDQSDSARFAPVFGERMRFRQNPEDKLAFIRALRAAGRRVLMVGDGLNDAGALAAADVGIAVSDDTACLVPACDVVVRGDRVRHLPALLRFARLSRSVVALCFTVSVVYNVLGLGFALAGRLTPLATAILMPVSSLTIIALSVGLTRRGARRLAEHGTFRSGAVA